MKIKGNVLTSRLTYVRQHFGQKGVEKIFLGLPEADRSVLENPINQVQWYDFDLGQRLDAAIVAGLGKGDPRIFEAMGAASAKQSLSTIHKFYLDPGNPQGFLLRAPLIYHVYYDQGWREYKPTSPTSGVMTTFEAETYSTTDCLTVIGWYKQALAMCGAKQVEMVEETCRARGGEFCRYNVRWASN
jgi:hypothetical protein